MPEEPRRQEEAHRVVAVPPLDHRVLRARIHVVGFPEADRDLRAVDQMQQRHGENESAEEPVGDVDVRDLALGEGAEEHDRIGHPHQRDEDVDRPFQLGVLVRGGDACRQRERRRYDHRLPAPEREGRELVGEQARMTGALDHVIAGREQRGAAECEDHGVGVQRPQPSIRQPGNAVRQIGKHELRGDHHTHQHADDAPHHRHDRELPDDLIVVGLFVAIRIHLAAAAVRCADIASPFRLRVTEGTRTPYRPRAARILRTGLAGAV